MDHFSFMLTVAYMPVPSLKISLAIDSIFMSQPMIDGETLVSKDGKFELGFFSTNNSSKRYLGIWYKNIPIQTVVWVANGANPINYSFGVLTLNSTGNLVLSQNGSIVWHSILEKQAQNPVAIILDSGNLAVKNEGEANREDYLWQSFDYPCDTFLPGIKLGWNLRTRLEWRITAWKNPEDPSQGQFYRSLALNPYPEFYLMNGTQRIFRFGPWNGLYYSGTPSLTNNNAHDADYVFNKDEVSIMYAYNDSVILRSVINQTSYKYQGVWWSERVQTWKQTFSFPGDECDTYGLCGPNGNCIPAVFPVCQCLKGFGPKLPQALDSWMCPK